MKQFLLVFVGGGLGSMARFGLAKILPNSAFPFGTFSANMLGCILIGGILGYYLNHQNVSQNTILILATGFCGGFTTFSAFAYENLSLLKEGNYGMFLIYALGTVILGILSVVAGIWLSKNL